jgi:DNA-binding ferritin-like protein (Dps family)
MNRTDVKKIADTKAKKEVQGHEKRMHKMAKGGVTSQAMKAVGRNMARANNQRGR